MGGDSAKTMCKFINIQQSTKTSGMGLLCKGSVSLSISNRVLKRNSYPFDGRHSVSLSISNRVLKPNAADVRQQPGVSLSISNRVLKR